MDEDNLRSRVGDVELVGVGRLPDHRLVFNRRGTHRAGGVSSVEPRKGAFVYGVVWVLSSAQFAKLDKIENPAAYERKTATIEMMDGRKELSCNIYIAYPVGQFEADQEYLKLLIGAATHHHLPRHYVRKLRSFIAG
jgi:hypothetical protein